MFKMLGIIIRGGPGCCYEAGFITPGGPNWLPSDIIRIKVQQLFLGTGLYLAPLGRAKFGSLSDIRQWTSHVFVFDPSTNKITLSEEHQHHQPLP